MKKLIRSASTFASRSATKTRYPCIYPLLPVPYDLGLGSIQDTKAANTSRSLSGFELFSLVSNFKHYTTIKHAWRRTPAEERKKFAYSALLDGHNQRVVNGYKYANSRMDDVNPYHGLGLFPWEIIKDKFRKETWSFDLYDRLIGEALNMQPRRVSGLQLFKTDEMNRRGRKSLNLSEAVRYFSELPKAEQQRYNEIGEKKLQHCLTVKALKNSKPQGLFGKFCVEMNPLVSGLLQQARNKEIGRLWRALSLEERAKYGVPFWFTSKVYKEQLLDRKTALVMDYIFNVGTVKGHVGSWREWKQRETQGLHYLNKVYFTGVLGTVGTHFRVVPFEHIS